MTVSNGSATNGHGQAIIDPRVATTPSAPERLAHLQKEIESHSQAYTNGNTDARLNLLETARSLVQAMETPQETMLRYCWAQPTAFAGIETCIDLGIFFILAQTDKPKTVAELAATTGAEPELLGRIMKHLATMGVFIETGMDEYGRNGLTTTLSIKRYNDAWPCINGCTLPAINALPAWLKKNDYRSPTVGTDCPFTLGFKTNYHFFEFLNGKNPDYPELGAQFNNLMSAYHQGRPSWMDGNFYPVETLIEGAKTGEEDVFIVDVGGNKGHDLEEFISKWPNTPGRLILQDQPHVLKDIKSLNPAIKSMVHDFYQEQPIKGARVYFLHSVLHDWNGETCRKILSQLVAAMTPGYSKLLINENVVPNTGAHWQATSLDLIMMVDLAAKERTEQQWHQVIEPVGLKIIKIWTPLDSAETKNFKYTTPVLAVRESKLQDTALLASKVYHYLASPQDMKTHVLNILALREKEGILDRPLIIWEPAPLSCRPENLEACLETAALVDVFSPNHLELAAFFGQSPVASDRSEIERLGEKLLASGVGPEGKGAVVIRAGENGCFVQSRNTASRWLPPFYKEDIGEEQPAKVVDPTGAGNAFLGGYAIGYLQGKGDILEAACYGSVAASFALEQVGMPEKSNEGGEELWNGESVVRRLHEYRARQELLQ
ncbi:hypothetical protein N7519_007528 [Penicillium mononematosum]|uniref:uncharacterized protein n=1 Tax=Penicillium mononematosum TaxID=268346 RepID=UPI002548B80D|nr:uncharacterized protein N7519_007528 [Penicillium mononematosum]KAJ6186227.1 hypothetical protein N7519_007528 [Penicillium mononematosum]